MHEQPKQYEIAEALGVTAGRVSQLKADGMPVDSVEAARAWYKRRVDPARSFGQRHAMGRHPSPVRIDDDEDDADDEGPTPAARIGLVCVVALAAADASANGYDIHAYLPALRLALADVPPNDHRFIALPLEVWRALHGTDAAQPPVREFVLLSD